MLLDNYITCIKNANVNFDPNMVHVANYIRIKMPVFNFDPNTSFIPIKNAKQVKFDPNKVICRQLYYKECQLLILI